MFMFHAKQKNGHALKYSSYILFHKQVNCKKVTDLNGLVEDLSGWSILSFYFV